MHGKTPCRQRTRLFNWLSSGHYSTDESIYVRDSCLVLIIRISALITITMLESNKYGKLYLTTTMKYGDSVSFKIKDKKAS